jgi:hypothetical protein
MWSASREYFETAGGTLSIRARIPGIIRIAAEKLRRDAPRERTVVPWRIPSAPVQVEMVIAR